MGVAVAAQPDRPVAGVDYPGSFGEFIDWFRSDADCWRYLTGLRWPDGFRCPRCGNSDAWLSDRRLYICTRCQKQTSVVAGTVFERSRVPLLDWFRAVWLMTSQKNGVSAKSLQGELDLSTYKAAWTLQHKLRAAMLRPDMDKLSGEIEIDETFLGGPRPGRRGRGAAGKQIVVIAVEKPTGHVQYGFGRARMRVIPDCRRVTLEDFITDVCEPGSIISTDGLSSYQHLPELGYEHIVTAISSTDDPAHVSMPAVHRVASLLKRWLLGTHQGGVAVQHLDSYLDEFVFRFNRRKARKRGLLFYRALQFAVRAHPLGYETLVWSRRGRADQERLRGPARGSHRVRPQ